MENKTIWQCHNPECNAQFTEYVNGCPKCATGEPGGSHKVSILNEYHPAFGNGYPKTPEMELILNIVSQWGNVIAMPNMEQWLKDYAVKHQPPAEAVWVKAFDRLPATNGGKYFVNFRESKCVCHYYNGRFQSTEWGLMDNSVLEWLDEGGEKEASNG